MPVIDRRSFQCCRAADLTGQRGRGWLQWALTSTRGNRLTRMARARAARPRRLLRRPPRHRRHRRPSRRHRCRHRRPRPAPAAAASHPPTTSTGAPCAAYYRTSTPVQDRHTCPGGRSSLLCVCQCTFIDSGVITAFCLICVGHHLPRDQLKARSTRAAKSRILQRAASPSSLCLLPPPPPSTCSTPRHAPLTRPYLSF